MKKSYLKPASGLFLSNSFLSNSFLSSLFFMSIWLIATTAHAQIGAHVHGLSNLTIVLDKNVIEMEFNTPAMNLVGFEHTASTQKDIDKVTNAKKILRQYALLYTFKGTQCPIESSSVDVSSLIDKHPKQNTNANEEKHGHHPKHEHDNSDNHNEVIAKFRFSCKNQSALKYIQVHLFEHFDGIEKINAMWVTDQGQGSVFLDKDNNIIKFR